MKKKTLLSLLTISTMTTTSLLGFSTEFSLNGGYSNYGNEAESGYKAGLGVQFMSESGLALDLGAHYLHIPENGGMVPIYLGAKYYLAPENDISAYGGGRFNINIMTNDYPSSIGLSALGGVRVRTSDNTSVFFELEKQFTNDELNFDPLTASVGFSLNFGDNGYSKPRRPIRPAHYNPVQNTIIEDPEVYYEDSQPNVVIIEKNPPVIVRESTPVIIHKPAPVIIHKPTPIIIKKPAPVIIKTPAPRVKNTRHYRQQVQRQEIQRQRQVIQRQENRIERQENQINRQDRTINRQQRQINRESSNRSNNRNESNQNRSRNTRNDNQRVDNSSTYEQLASVTDANNESSKESSKVTNTNNKQNLADAVARLTALAANR